MTLTTLTLGINISTETGVLDITGVTLGDFLNVYGIKQTLDNVVIVPNNTAATLVETSPGIGSAVYQTTLLSNSVDYTVSWKISYTLDAVPFTEYVTTSLLGAVAIRSLAYLRKSLADRLGGFDSLVTSGDSASNTQLNVDSLIGEIDDSGAYQQSWVYITSGDSQGDQRRISVSGIDSVSGVITVNRPFSSTILSGTSFEIHTRLPAIRQALIPGIREVLNQALAGMWTVDRVPFPSSSSEDFLLTPDWLTNRGQILDVFRPSAAGYRPFMVGNAYTFRYDAEQPFLEGVQNTESGWEMDVVRPGNTWIKVNGIWQDSTSGLVSDTDECLFPPQVMVAVGLYYAYEALSKATWQSDTERGAYANMAKDWAPIAANVKRNYMPDIDTQSPNKFGHTNTPMFGMKGLLGW